MGGVRDTRMSYRLKALPPEEAWLSEERSVFCAKDNRELWQFGAGLTPPVWGRMDRGLTGKGDSWKSGLAGADRGQAVGAWCPG